MIFAALKEGSLKISLKNRQQLLVLVAAATVALLAADKLVITPLSNSWKARSAKVAELSKKVHAGRGLVQRERALRERWQYMRANTLTNNSSQAEQQVLKAFDTWARQSQVSLLSISPQWKHDSEEFTTLECRVEAAGNLNTLTRFLYELERDPMALRVQALELNCRDNEGQQLALGLQVSGLVLSLDSERSGEQERR